MTKLEGVRACVFDAYGTLFYIHAPLRKLAPEIGPEAENISKLWRQKQLEYSFRLTAMEQYQDFAWVTARALEHALAATGLRLRRTRE